MGKGLKYLKLFEELKSSTYFSAKEKLRNLGYEDRADRMNDYYQNVLYNELLTLCEEYYTKDQTFNLELNGDRGDFYLLIRVNGSSTLQLFLIPTTKNLFNYLVFFSRYDFSDINDPEYLFLFYEFLFDGDSFDDTYYIDYIISDEEAEKMHYFIMDVIEGNIESPLVETPPYNNMTIADYYYILANYSTDRWKREDDID